MPVGIIVVIALASALAALIIFMIIRTVLVKEPVIKTDEFKPIEVDANLIAQHVSDAVKVPTVTVIDEEMQSYEPFLEYHKYLEKTYPLIFSVAEKKVINGYSLVLIIKGTDPSLLPGAFLAHQDVVPAPAEGWETDPFGGEIKEGYVYGRGSRDMKGQMIANLEAMELLLKRGETPKRTVYFCFGHDEEYTGRKGAKFVSQWLSDNNIKFDFVVDEGGAIVDASKAGIPGKIALIGTCEKGYVDYTLTSAIPGGHASAPERHCSVDQLCRAVYELNNVQMKSYWSEPLKLTCKSLAPYVKNFAIKAVLVNRDILSPLIKGVARRLHPLAGSLFKTTFAFTQLQGSDAPNVIPPSAQAVVNVRINTGETQKDVERHMKKVMGSKVKVGILTEGYDPSPVSSVDGPQYKALVKSIREVFPNYVPLPYCFIAASDSKHYCKVCDNVYRFTPFFVSSDDQHRIHALNERIDIDGLVKATRFFARFIENTCINI